MLNQSKKIKLLPEHLIDQIKAGEVIERSGNLLKEIIENSIDAGASRIEIQIKNNGLDLIRLKDNGHGIAHEDLPLAFSRHATSKISDFEDIYQLNSFGFRGEALASISAISKVHCISSTSDQIEASEIKWEGGKLVYHGTKNAISQGTELVIQDLFYNTPARMKFIQSQNSEKKFLKKIIYSFILSYPTIEFIIQFDDREKDFFSPEVDIIHRLGSILPKLNSEYFFSSKTYDDLNFEITLIPKHIKTPIPWDYFFVNQRMILDKQFHRVIGQCLLSKFGHDEFHYIGRLSGDKRNIDVNVHPSKTSIKCFESSKIYSLISSTIKDLLLKTEKEMTHRLTPQMSGFSEVILPIEESMRERSIEQNYRLDGTFSPHNTSPISPKQYLWIGEKYFLNQEAFGYYVFNAKKLIKQFIDINLNKRSMSLPLLVSIPIKAPKENKNLVDKLILAGTEIDQLLDGTLLIRAIPEWLSNTPLKEIFEFILIHQNLEILHFNPQDWPDSIWEEMIQSIGLQEIIRCQIGINILEILQEKLK
jgi:DNA mismatch repair protein MutL